MTNGLISPEVLGNIRDRFPATPEGTFAVVIVEEPTVKEREEEGEFILTVPFQIEGGDHDGKRIRRSLFLPGERASSELASINWAVGFDEDEYAAMENEGLSGVTYAGRRLNVQVKRNEYTPKDQKHLPEAEQQKKTAENWRYMPYDAEAALA